MAAQNTECSVALVLADANLLGLILAYLPPAALCVCQAVNRAFRTASRAPSLWHTMDVESIWRESQYSVPDSVDLSPESLPKVLRSMLALHGPHVKTLRYKVVQVAPGGREGEDQEVASPGLMELLPSPSVSQWLPALEELELEGPGAMQCCRSLPPGMRSLTIRGDSEGLSQLAPLLDPGPPPPGLNLSVLDLKGMGPMATVQTTLVDRLLAWLCSGHQLQRLALGWLGEAAASNWDRVVLPAATGRPQPTHTLACLSLSHATLSHLNLGGIHVQRMGGPLGGGALLPPLTQLQTLNLANLTLSWPGQGWVGLGAWRPVNLVGLNLRSCSWVRLSELSHLLAITPSLERLNISCVEGLGDRLLEQLPGSCPRLTLLDVCYCGGMSAAGLTNCVAGLQHLCQLGCSGFSDLDDAGLHGMLRQHGHRLTMLGCGGCPLLTDTSLCSVADLAAPSLTSLYIAHLPRITAAGLARVLKSCRRLTKLCTRAFYDLPDDDALALARGLSYEYDGDLHA